MKMEGKLGEVSGCITCCCMSCCCSSRSCCCCAASCLANSSCLFVCSSFSCMILQDWYDGSHAIDSAVLARS